MLSIQSVLTSENLVNWLRQQPAEQEYDFMAIRDCVIARFLQAQGVEFDFVTGYFVVGTDSTSTEIPEGVSKALLEMPTTYGAALSRLEALAD